MRWLKTVAIELLGLFVDDGRLSITLLLWLGACFLLLPRLRLPSSWLGVILAAGLLVILAESALRAARGARR